MNIKPIRNDDDYKATLKQIEALMNAGEKIGRLSPPRELSVLPPPWTRRQFSATNY